MKYILLIYNNEKAWTELPQAEQHAIFGEYMGFTADLKKAGQYVGGEPLEPSTTATTVKLERGKTIHVDGPFAETKEQLGGYYIVDCKNLDEAIAWAAKIPDVKHGGLCEVRPLMVIPS
jgi:hypothetical protein